MFSGAGGLDIGFSDVGFNIVGSVEIDKKFCDTLLLNTEENKYFCKSSTYSVAPCFDFLGGMAQEKILFFATVGFETSRLCFWSVQF